MRMVRRTIRSHGKERLGMREKEMCRRKKNRKWRRKRRSMRNWKNKIK